MPGIACLHAPWLDLDLSMYPSFLSSLYSYVSRQHWVKILGEGVGTRIYMVRDSLCCAGPACSYELLRGLSGAWCLDECREGIRADPRLANVYEGLVIASATGSLLDRVLVAAAVVLSRRTRYATNVRRWMRIIFNGVKRLGIGELSLAAKRARGLPSPQPRQLARILQELAMAMENASDAWRARRELLSIPGIGPKTSDAILLFTGLTSWVAPSDTHLERFASEVLGLQARRPSKQACRRSPGCPWCPLRYSCLSGAIVSRFRGAAGLVQTIAYVYGRLGASEWRRRLYTELERYYR